MKKIVTMLAAFIVGGMAYHIVTNISPSDVVAYHKLDQELGGFRAHPADVVAVSPDGQRAQRICLGGTGPEEWDRTDIDAVYVNDLGRVLPRYVDIWATVAQTFGAASETAPDRIAFLGDLRSLRDEAQPDVRASCECAMAKRLLARERVCTVHGALVERGGLVRAIQFKTFSNVVPPQVFEKCGLPYNQNVEKISGQRCASANLPWDVIVRNRLNLIEPELVSAAGLELSSR